MPYTSNAQRNPEAGSMIGILLAVSAGVGYWYLKMRGQNTQEPQEPPVDESQKQTKFGNIQVTIS